MLAQSMTWAIKINYFLIFTSLILGCFHQLIYPIKFDFSISVPHLTKCWSSHQ